MRDLLGFRSMPWLLLCLSWGCSSCNSSATAPAGAWPSSAPEAQGFDSEELASVIEKIDAEGLPFDSVQIVRNGVLVLDAYFYPYLGEQPHDVASVTKSITSTLVGIAIDRGLLKLEDGMLERFGALGPPPTGDGKETITLEHLLTMSSGMACGFTPGEQELYAMLASENYVEYALSLPMATPPGVLFSYCSPGSHLLSAMLSDVTGQTTLAFAMEHLFAPLGISEVAWPADPQGVNHGWGDLQLHPHDMARVGLLFLNEGKWNDTRVVSRDWVRAATRSSIDAGGSDTGYGYQWWVLRGVMEGVYEARGRGGQAIVIWPARDLVAVFTGRGIDVRGEIAPLLAAALKSDDALPANKEGHARLQDALAKAKEAPEASAVPELPSLAQRISGMTYRIESNQFDVRCVALRFDSAEEVTFTLELGDGAFELPVGMDGVPRFSQSGPTGIPVGVSGAWTAATVFEMAYDEIAGPNHLLIRAEFETDAERLTLLFTDPAGHFAPQLVAGQAAESCQ